MFRIWGARAQAEAEANASGEAEAVEWAELVEPVESTEPQPSPAVQIGGIEKCAVSTSGETHEPAAQGNTADATTNKVENSEGAAFDFDRAAPPAGDNVFPRNNKQADAAIEIQVTPLEARPTLQTADANTISASTEGSHDDAAGAAGMVQNIVVAPRDASQFELDAHGDPVAVESSAKEQADPKPDTPAAAAPAASVPPAPKSGTDAISSIPWAVMPSGELRILGFGRTSIAAEEELDPAPKEKESRRKRRHRMEDAIRFNADGKRQDPVAAADVGGVITATDLGGGYAVTLRSAGQWLEFTVDVKLVGTYHVEFRLADERQAGGTCHLQIDSENVSGAIRVPKDADFSAWRQVSKNGGVTLGAGPHVVRIWFDAIGATGSIPADFSYFRLVRADLAVEATPPPQPPTDVRATVISASRIDLTWTDPSGGGTGFKIERARKDEVFTTIAMRPPGSTSYSDSTLAANTKYYYRVRATTAGGDSKASEQAKATTREAGETVEPTEAPLQLQATLPPPPPPPAAAPPPPEEVVDAASIEPTSAPEPGVQPDAEPHDVKSEISNPPATVAEPPAAPQQPDPVVSSTSEGNLPAGWSAAIVGVSASSGSVTYDRDAGAFVVAGAGSDIWGRLDGFCFVYRAMEGNGQIVARVTGLPRADLAAKAGIMIRQTLDPDSKHVALLMTPTAGVRFVRRPESAGATTNMCKTDNRAVTTPCWLKLERRGVTLTAYRSRDGNHWQFVGTEFVGMSASVYVGLAVTSHAPAGAAGHFSTFDHISAGE